MVDVGTKGALLRCAVSVFDVSGEPMGSDQDRLYGADCLRLAKLVSNESDRLLLLHMADAWRRLAERSESQPDNQNGWGKVRFPIE
jgi:hypothetical protein